MLKQGLFLEYIPELLAHGILKQVASQLVHNRSELEIQLIIHIGLRLPPVPYFPQRVQLLEWLLLADRIHPGRILSRPTPMHLHVRGVAQGLELAGRYGQLGQILVAGDGLGYMGCFHPGDELGVVLSAADHRIDYLFAGLDDAGFVIADG